MTIESYNVGDLVDFTVPRAFETAKRRYRAPGIVIEVREHLEGFNTFKKIYAVRWSDGKVTTEWECYLSKLSDVRV